MANASRRQCPTENIDVTQSSSTTHLLDGPHLLREAFDELRHLPVSLIEFLVLVLLRPVTPLELLRHLHDARLETLVLILNLLDEGVHLLDLALVRFHLGDVSLEHLLGLELRYFRLLL